MFYTVLVMGGRREFWGRRGLLHQLSREGEGAHTGCARSQGMALQGGRTEAAAAVFDRDLLGEKGRWDARGGGAGTRVSAAPHLLRRLVVEGGCAVCRLRCRLWQAALWVVVGCSVGCGGGPPTKARPWRVSEGLLLSSETQEVMYAGLRQGQQWSPRMRWEKGGCGIPVVYLTINSQTAGGWSRPRLLIKLHTAITA